MMSPGDSITNARTQAISALRQIGYWKRRNLGKAASEVLKADGFHNCTESAT
jgi:hypothetical protein